MNIACMRLVNVLFACASVNFITFSNTNVLIPNDGQKNLGLRRACRLSPVKVTDYAAKCRAR